MPSDEDIALDEKRMYGDRREETVAYVACEMGVARVALSDDQIGRFGLEHRCSAHDIAGGGGQLAVATDEDVLLGSAGAFTATGFGPAVAVGIDDTIVAADADGRIARLAGDDWVSVGSVDTVHAMDGDVVAATDGVYRIDGDDLVALDGAAAVDVTAGGPFAATERGVCRWSDGWHLEASGAATVVTSEGDGKRAHAVVDDELLARADGEWQVADPPAEGVVDLAYDAATVAVTADGIVMIDPVTAKDGAPQWRSRTLGLAGAVGVAVL